MRPRIIDAYNPRKSLLRYDVHNFVHVRMSSVFFLTRQVHRRQRRLIQHMLIRLARLHKGLEYTHLPDSRSTFQ